MTSFAKMFSKRERIVLSRYATAPPVSRVAIAERLTREIGSPHNPTRVRQIELAVLRQIARAVGDA